MFNRRSSPRRETSVRDLNLAPLLRDPTQKSDITGHAMLDIRMSAPAACPAGRPSASALSRLRGTFSPGRPAGGCRRICRRQRQGGGRAQRPANHLDGRADAYGGSASARGFVAPPAASGEPLQFDLTGSASHLNLARLPASVNAPRVATSINADNLSRRGRNGAGDGPPSTAAPRWHARRFRAATITAGTDAAFHYAARGARSAPDVSYSAKGGVRNLDLQAVGQAFDIAALARPQYASRINADVTVRAAARLRPR